MAGIGLSALRRLEAGRGSTLRTALAVLSALDLPLSLPDPSTGVTRRRAPGLPPVPDGLTRREERTSWYPHRAVAAKLYGPERPRILKDARANLEALAENVHGPGAHVWLERWRAALDGPLGDLVTVMLSTDRDGVDLRQMSPFAGVLTHDERLAAIHEAIATA